MESTEEHWKFLVSFSVNSEFLPNYVEAQYCKKMGKHIGIFSINKLILNNAHLLSEDYLLKVVQNHLQLANPDNL